MKIKGYICDKPVLFWFPSLPENCYEKKLISPLGAMQYSLDWGEVHSWKEGMFCVKALMFAIRANEAIVQSIYEDFPKWRKIFNSLIMIQTCNFAYIEQKRFMLVQQNIDTYDTLNIFEANPDEDLRLIDNKADKKDIQIQMIECFDLAKMEQLFEDAGFYGEIPVWYELLITAYRAAIQQDFRSAIIIAENALKNVILTVIEEYYDENEVETFEDDQKQYQTLEQIFEWLNKIGIELSVNDCQKEILEINRVSISKLHSYEYVKKHLDKCKLIIQELNMMYWN